MVESDVGLFKIKGGLAPMESEIDIAVRKKAERAVTLYMKALENVELPESIWHKIATANRQILDK